MGADTLFGSGDFRASLPRSSPEALGGELRADRCARPDCEVEERHDRALCARLAAGAENRGSCPFRGRQSCIDWKRTRRGHSKSYSVRSTRDRRRCVEDRDRWRAIHTGYGTSDRTLTNFAPFAHPASPNGVASGDGKLRVLTQLLSKRGARSDRVRRAPSSSALSLSQGS